LILDPGCFVKLKRRPRMIVWSDCFYAKLIIDNKTINGCTCRISIGCG
jgi:hypothetical protein